jgi:transcriptional regulator with PAS, ATPase and Fis domain
MSDHAWVEEFGAAVTVCDAAGIIREMNHQAAATFEADGGMALVGRDLRDCHPGAAREKLERLLESREPNVYTIQKGDSRKLIYQVPWYRDGVFAGIVEISLPLPAVVPHFVREPGPSQGMTPA